MDNISDRIYMIRKKILNYSRSSFVKYGIPQTTLRNWETKKVNIDSNQLSKLISAFESCGVICDEKWLRTGEGVSPFDQNFKTLLTHWNTNSDVDYIVKNNNNSKAFSVNTEYLKPFISIGDVVIGVQKAIDNFEDLFVVQDMDMKIRIGFCQKVSQSLFSMRYINHPKVDIFRKKEIVHSYAIFHIRRFNRPS